MAEILKARVQRDDGKIHRSPTEFYPEDPATSSPDPNSHPTKTHWWNRVFGKQGTVLRSNFTELDI